MSTMKSGPAIDVFLLAQRVPQMVLPSFSQPNFSISSKLPWAIDTAFPTSEVHSATKTGSIPSRKAVSNHTLKKGMIKTRHDAMNVDQHSLGLPLCVVQFNPSSKYFHGTHRHQICAALRTQKIPIFPCLLTGHCLNNQSYDDYIAVMGNMVMNLECLAH